MSRRPHRPVGFLPRRRRRERRKRDWGEGLDVVDCCDSPCLIAHLGLVLTMLVRTAGGYFRVPPVTDAPSSQRVVLRALRSYQAHVSPRRGPVCHLEPTCSRYAIISVRQRGLLRSIPAMRARFRACAQAGRAGRA
ncbi:membrane protein insertion efficiency factor YidD [Nocardioides sp.]|uniref:membrane protein insertion efficiency factor YidD n=1 Tax=Nocardioides sp. TaxID=35761 RepID=UPI003513E78C